jgi:hypothetical protein
MSVPLVTGVLLAAAIGFHWINAWLAAGFSGLSVLVFVAELGFYRQLIDPFYPKRTSHNVVAIQPSSGKVTRRLVLNAHTDAAFEWRLHYRFPTIFPSLLLYTLICLFVVFVVDVTMLALGSWIALRWSVVWLAADIVQVLCIPAALVGLSYTNFARVAPGANDNLSGTFIVLGLARFLKQANVRLENTELVYLITGAEEAGTRGATAFARRHRSEWNDVETVFIALDTIRDLDYLRVYTHDRNALIRHDAAVCALLREAGRRAGLELANGSVYLGSSDAAVFTDWGVRSAALCAMDPRPARFYHTRLDDFTNMSRPCVLKTCEVLWEAVAWYDRHGLADAPADGQPSASRLAAGES